MMCVCVGKRGGEKCVCVCVCEGGRMSSTPLSPIQHTHKLTSIRKLIANVRLHKE